MMAVKKNYRFPFVLLALLLTVACIHIAHAQFFSNTDVTVSMIPENPGSFQNTTITLSSLSTDLSLAAIQWTVGGQTVLSGTGKTVYNFKTGAVGATSTIKATIDVPGVPTINKSITITPVEADLLWEAVDSYVPPFYKGKALLSSEGMVKVVAIPNMQSGDGTMLKPGDFSYAWTRNYNNDTTASGFGKNSYIFRDNYLNDQENVSVSLSSLVGNYKATENISIIPTAPNVLVYQNDPKLGIAFQRAIKGDSYFSIRSSGASLIALPYYFSPKDAQDPQLEYTWTVNGSIIPTPATKNIFSIKPTETGVAQVKVAIDNTMKLFQTASRNLFLSLQAQ